MVENIMDKLAEKIGGQDIIKANARAEAMEAERTKQEAEQYRQQLEELRQNEREHRASIEDTKASLEEAKASIMETQESLNALSEKTQMSLDVLSGRTQSSLEVLSGKTQESLDALAGKTQESLDVLSDRIGENETKVHDVGVQVYRNVQAIVEKGQEKNADAFKELNRRGEAIQVAIETKNSAVLPLLIVTLLVAGADLVINIMRILGIL